MTKQEIVNYVCETPGNTNPAVLSSMLDSFEEDNGFVVINLDDCGVPIFSMIMSGQTSFEYETSDVDPLFSKITDALKRNKMIVFGTKMTDDIITYVPIQNYTKNNEGKLLYASAIIAGNFSNGVAQVLIRMKPGKGTITFL